jgi:peptidoglycan/xylan/chitin deacetylase (PgdA/CDA1 family)
MRAPAGKSSVRVRALMYHDVLASPGESSGFEGSGAAVYSVSAERFGEHLDRIEQSVGRPPATVDAFKTDDPWMITFDDGGASAVAAGEELARRGWRGHFFIVTDLVGTPRFVDWDGVRALADQGHAIGSHSRSHPQPISACSWDDLLDEWSHSVQALSEAIGRPVSTGSVPGGYLSPTVARAAAAAGIETLFTSEPVQTLREIDGCLLIGRYAIRRDTDAATAAAAAAGAARPWLSQRASWSLRKAAKRAGGRNYERLRSAMLDRG